MNPAVEYLESEEYFWTRYKRRWDNTHLRHMFQVLTDHNLDAETLEARGYGPTEAEMMDALASESGDSTWCELCGHDPIILGADNVDST